MIVCACITRRDGGTERIDPMSNWKATGWHNVYEIMSGMGLMVPGPLAVEGIGWWRSPGLWIVFCHAVVPHLLATSLLMSEMIAHCLKQMRKEADKNCA